MKVEKKFLKKDILINISKLNYFQHTKIKSTKQKSFFLMYFLTLKKKMNLKKKINTKKKINLNKNFFLKKKKFFFFKNFFLLNVLIFL